MDQDGKNLEYIPGRRQSVHGYILTSPGLKERTFGNSGFSAEGTLISERKSRAYTKSI